MTTFLTGLLVAALIGIALWRLVDYLTPRHRVEQVDQRTVRVHRWVGWHVFHDELWVADPNLYGMNHVSWYCVATGEHDIWMDKRINDWLRSIRLQDEIINKKEGS